MFKTGYDDAHWLAVETFAGKPAHAMTPDEFARAHWQLRYKQEFDRIQAGYTARGLGPLTDAETTGPTGVYALLLRALDKPPEKRNWGERTDIQDVYRDHATLVQRHQKGA